MPRSDMKNVMLIRKLIKRKKTCEKIDCSEMQLHRLRKDPKYKHLNFPAARLINGRPHWYEDEIDSWIESHDKEVV